MKINLEHWNEATDGELCEENMTNKLQARGYRVSCYVYPPKTCFPDHTHSIDKIDGVLSGTFKMTLYREDIILKAGDCLEVPAGAIHSAEVMGNEPVVSLDAIKL